MSWVKIDDHAHEHRKQLEAGPAACWLWVCGLMYCNRQAVRSGAIPASALQTIGVKGAAQLAEKLVAVGLWVRTDDGFAVHDYFEYQPTADQQAERRAKRAAAGAIGGRRSGEARREATTKQVASASLQPTKHRVEAKANPDPDPDPDPEEEDPRSFVPQGGTGAPAESKTSEAIDEVYAAFVAAKKRWKPTSRPAPKLVDPKLRKAVKLLLASGRSVADLKLACEGLFLSPHHLGQNDRSTEYLDFEYVATKPKNIDAFVSLAEDAGRGGVAASTSPRGSLRDVPTAEELAAVDRAAVQRTLAERVGALTAKMTPTLPLLPEEVGQ